MFVSQVANVKKETVFHWLKDEEEIVLATPPNVMSGSVALPISLVTTAVNLERNDCTRNTTAQGNSVFCRHFLK